MKPPQHQFDPEELRQSLLLEETGHHHQVQPIYDEDEGFAAQILDSKYEKQDLRKVADQQIHLKQQQRNSLYDRVFKGRERLFAGTLGVWPHEQVSAKLKPDAVPYHCQRPMRIPHIHLETLRKEVDRLVKTGVLQEVDGAHAGPWCAPSFIVAKKDGRVRFITDYRELNKWIQRRPWPMPHISDLIQDIGAYKFVTAIDLSMGYYHFELDDELSDMTTFMLPWGLYKYKHLPMGLNISPDKFQERLSKLMAGLPNVRVYLDDIICWTNGTYEDHLKQVASVLDRLASKGLAVNALKSFWAVQEVDYLGFRLTPQGVLLQPKKIKAIQNLEQP